MGARQKLNAGYFQGSLLLAALAGGLSSSWGVFAVALGLLIVGNVIAGDIRGKRHDRR